MPLAFFPLVAQAQPPAKSAPAYLPPLTERMNEFPSLCQHDERGGFLLNGQGFCGPVAASNALVWLATHGYPRLLPDENGDDLYGGVTYATQSKTLKAQVALVHALTGENFVKMNGDGASTTYVARGVRAYVESKGYAIDRLQVATVLQNQPADVRVSARVLTMNAVKEAFQKGAVVWLAIGWYEQTNIGSDEPTYTRHGGHFVTLVGYGKDASGQVDDTVLIFRNPSQRAGRNYPNEFVRLRPMTGGRFAGWDGKEGRPVAGYFEAVGGLVVGARTTAILEQATILVLKPPTP